MKQFSRKKIELAKEVTNIQNYFFWPRSQDIEGYIENGKLLNCAPSPQEVKIRNKIYGEPMPLIQGKLTR